jgi:hypothetical protein
MKAMVSPRRQWFLDVCDEGVKPDYVSLILRHPNVNAQNGLVKDKLIPDFISLLAETPKLSPWEELALMGGWMGQGKFKSRSRSRSTHFFFFIQF